MKKTKPESVVEYVALAEQFTWLVDAELTNMERYAAEGNTHDVIERLPALMSAVNVVGFLRGQDGMFLEARPSGVAQFQQQLYEAEDEVEKRLANLIAFVSQDPQTNEEYVRGLRAYYIEARQSA